MKITITRSGDTETWLKTEYFCPQCGSERVWVNEQELLGCEDEQYVCLTCAFMFTMPVGGEITDKDSDLIELLRELRDATNKNPDGESGLSMRK